MWFLVPFTFCTQEFQGKLVVFKFTNKPVIFAKRSANKWIAGSTNLKMKKEPICWKLAQIYKKNLNDFCVCCLNLYFSSLTPSLLCTSTPSWILKGQLICVFPCPCYYIKMILRTSMNMGEGDRGFVIDNDELLRTIWWEHKRILPGGPRALHLCY
jgi:hypothetical protein